MAPAGSRSWLATSAWRLSGRDLDHVHVGVRGGLVGFGEERGLAFLAVPLREPVRCQAAHRRPGADVDPATVLGGNQAFVLQQPQRVAGRHPGNTVVGHQLRLARQLITRPEPLPAYRRAQVISYLLVDSTITGRVDRLGEHRSRNRLRSSTPADVYATNVMP